jgi:hydrogenase/urease accessory protein HupE
MICADRVSRKAARALVASLAAVLFAAPAAAHPLAPGLLDLREREDGTLRLLFKLPRKRELGVHLVPRLPDGCRVVSESEAAAPANAIARIQEVDCGGAPLVGKLLGVDGIERSRSGVLVRVQLAGAAAQSRMLDANAPNLTIAAAPTVGSVLRDFFALGVEHLVTGVDHVLFLLALTLLVGWGRRLFWTLTSFTVGHSVTLSLAALGHVDFPVAFVESLIAFSIVVAAAEIAHPEGPGWFARHPALAAGAFGLLHGMGFAGALAEVGLPAGEIPLALLAFNLGIEVGQLLVVTIVLLLARLLAAPLRAAAPRGLRLASGYALGTVAAIWFWQRSGFPPTS